MKNLIYTFLLLAAIGCQIDKQAYISGTLTNPQEDHVVFKYGEITDTIYLDSLSGFQYSISLDKPEHIYFKHKKNKSHMYLSAGDKIHVSVDCGQFKKTLIYSGKGSSKNNYLAQMQVIVGNEIMKSTGELCRLSPDDFLSKIDSFSQVISKLYTDSVESIASIDNDFKQKQKLKIKYVIASNKMMYPRLHKRLTDNEVPDTSSFYNFLSELDVNNAELLDEREYVKFLNEYINYKAKRLETDEGHDHDHGHAEDDHFDEIFKKMEAVEHEITNPDVANFLYTDFIKFPLMYYGAARAEPLITRYLEVCRDSNYTREIDSIYKMKLLVAPGEPAPAFTLFDINNKEVSLDDFKGKIVYIDFWATWCAPCRAELPHYKELQKRFKGDDRIAFLSISLDSDKEKWVEMVNEKELSGYQLITDKAWASDVAKDYQIYGIPTFVMIDANGKFIDSQAPSPSSDDIDKLINKQLKKI